jgi:hypothetical protein
MMLLGWLGGKEQPGACDKAAELGQWALQYVQHVCLDGADNRCHGPAQHRGGAGGMCLRLRGLTVSSQTQSLCVS